MEFQASRLPRAELMPLDHLREDMHNLDSKQTYIVYSGGERRSKAAVYLLNERNIRAMSLTGGIREWPYEVDVSPIVPADTLDPSNSSHKTSA